MKEWAERFAEQLLKDNLRLEEFQVSLVGYEDFDRIIARLESLGCTVTADRRNKRLTVVCPRSGGGGSDSSDKPKGEKQFRIDKVKRPLLPGYDLSAQPKAMPTQSAT